MKKTYLLNGFAVLALGFAAVGCSHDSDYKMPSSVDKLANAAEKLGVEIDPNQDWNMTGTVTASVSVNLGLDQEYTVGIYDANPLFNTGVHFYAKQTIKEGETVDMTFEAPSVSRTFYVAVFDSKNRRVVNAANIEDGKLVANIGGASVAGTRAVESDYTTDPNSYAKTLNDYLNPVVEKVNSWDPDVETVTISLEEMKTDKYVSINDDMIVNQTSQGNHTLTDKSWNVAPEGAFLGYGDGKHFRVDAGVEITEYFNISAANVIHYEGWDDYKAGRVNEAVLYIEGTVKLDDDCTLNAVTLVVAPGGKIKLDGKVNMSGTGRFVVMPGGTIEGSDGVTFNVNNGGYCYNAGTIKYKGELNVNGCNVYNNGTIDVDVLRNTAGGKFTNFGKITARTNIGAGDAYNSKIINGCYMHYKEDAGIGTLIQLDNSRLEVGGMAEFNQDDQYLYNNSIIDAGSIMVNATSFFGSKNTSDVAIIKTKKIVFASNIYINQNKGDQYQTERYTYVARKLDGYGTIYLDWDPYETYNIKWENNVKVPGDKITDDNGYTMLSVVLESKYNYISESSSMIIIPKGDCTGKGYNAPKEDGTTQTPDPVDERPAVWSYAFEDTPLGDYDMNDVVLKVSYHYDEATKKVDESHLDVTLCCTGATLQLKAYLNQTALFGGQEVHKALGKTAPEMLNTGVGSDVPTTTVTIDTPTDFQFGTADFWIESPLVPGGVHIAKQGEDPHGVVIPADWAWPKEYINIKEAYPNFIEFAKDASTTNEAVLGWYKQTTNNPVADKTYGK